MHGGTSRGAGAPEGNKNAWKHGDRTAEAEEQLKAISQSNRDIRMLQKLNDGRQLTSIEYDRLLTLYLDREARP